MDDAREEAPAAARVLGLDGRYRYFYGASGRRYLFSSVPVETLEDYRNAVLLIEADAKPWIGEIDRYGKRHGRKLPSRRLAKARAYVHLLAEETSDRQAALSDLLKALG